MALLCLLFLAFHFLTSSAGIGALLSPSEPWLLLGAQQKCWQSSWSHCWCSDSSSFSEPAGNVPWLLPGGLFQPKEESTSNKNQADGLEMAVWSREGSAALTPPRVTCSGGLCMIQSTSEGSSPNFCSRQVHQAGSAWLCSAENLQGQGPTGRAAERSCQCPRVLAARAEVLSFWCNSLHCVTEEQYPMELERPAWS